MRIYAQLLAPAHVPSGPDKPKAFTQMLTSGDHGENYSIPLGDSSDVGS